MQNLATGEIADSVREIASFRTKIKDIGSKVMMMKMTIGDGTYDDETSGGDGHGHDGVGLLEVGLPDLYRCGGGGDVHDDFFINSFSTMIKDFRCLRWTLRWRR